MRHVMRRIPVQVSRKGLKVELIWMPKFTGLQDPLKVVPGLFFLVIRMTAVTNFFICS
jgi:hypothetical protein